MSEEIGPNIKFQLKGGVKRKKIVDSSAIVDEDESDVERQVEEGSERKKEEELVIPLVNPAPRVIEKRPKKVEIDSLDALAVEELIRELAADPNKSTTTTSTLIIETSESKQKSSKTPLLLASQPSELDNIQNEDERFKIDISLRPETVDVRSQTYKNVPVEQFGAALLRGMGWTGPTADDEVYMKRLDPTSLARDGRLGLGALPPPPESKKKSDKNNERKDEWKKKVEEKLKKQVLKEGDLVWIRTGIHVGKRAQIISVKGVAGLDKIRLRMERDGHVVDIGRTEAALLSPEELERTPYVLTFKDVPAAPADIVYKGMDDKKTVSKTHASSSSAAAKQTTRTERAPSPPKNWLTSSIRVRIISKSFGGRVYLQKGTVEDIYGSGLASVRLDDGSVIESVKEKHLETVLPSSGGGCKVLRGAHRGQHARLLEKKQETQRVIVQLSEDYEIVELSFDDIAALAL